MTSGTSSVIYVVTCAIVLASVFELLCDYPSTSELTRNYWAIIEVMAFTPTNTCRKKDYNYRYDTVSGNLENVFAHHRIAILFIVRSYRESVRTSARGRPVVRDG